MSKDKLSPLDLDLLHNIQANINELYRIYGVKPKKNISFRLFRFHFSVSY